MQQQQSTAFVSDVPPLNAVMQHQLVSWLMCFWFCWILGIPQQLWHALEQPNAHLHVARWPHGRQMIPLSAFQQMMHASLAQFSLYCFTALLERSGRLSRTASDSGCTTTVLLLIGSGKSGSTVSGLSAMPLGSGPNSCPCSPASSALYTGLGVCSAVSQYALLSDQCNIDYGRSV